MPPRKVGLRGERWRAPKKQVRGFDGACVRESNGKMAFGLKSIPGNGGDYLPIVKYDAKAGRLFRVDKDPVTFDKETVDITTPAPRFALDFGTLEVGWIHFSANGPEYQLVPVGTTPPPMPLDKDEQGKFKFREGFRAKLSGTVLGGLREWSSCAKSVVGAVEALYDQYSTAVEAATGYIPVVELQRAQPITTGKQVKTTSYAPVFRIVGWTDRTPEMGARTVPIPQRPKSRVEETLDEPIPF